jgi:hypothetical protein
MQSQAFGGRRQHQGEGVGKAGSARDRKLVAISIDREAKREKQANRGSVGIRSPSSRIAGQGEVVVSRDCGTLPGQPPRKSALAHPDLLIRIQPPSVP